MALSLSILIGFWEREREGERGREVCTFGKEN